MAGGIFGFEMPIQDKKTKMPIHFQFVSSFIISSLFQLSNLNLFSYVYLICCRCLVDKLWCSSNLQKIVVQILNQTCSSSGCKHN